MRAVRNKLMEVHTDARRDHVMPQSDRKQKQNESHDPDAPPAPPHWRGGFQAGPVDVFGELSEVGFGAIQATEFSETFQPVLFIQANVPAVAAHNPFAQHAPRQLVEEVSLE